MCAIEFYTYEDYKKWEGRWELIDGIPLAMAPAPLPTHQLIATLISYQLNSQIQNCKNCVVLGEVDYKVSDETILRPDVVVTCERLNKPFITNPKIIFEIVSPSSARRDEKFKFEIYEKEKINYYILVYPNDNIAKAYELKNNKFEKIPLSEKYQFKLNNCNLEVDFDEIFKRVSIIS